MHHAQIADAGGADANSAEDDAGREGPPDPGLCDSLALEIVVELNRVIGCSTGSDCEVSEDIGGRCPGSLLPDCGFVHRVGADLSRLDMLDRRVDDARCLPRDRICRDCDTLGPIVCGDEGTCDQR